jgi:protease-4
MSASTTRKDSTNPMTSRSAARWAAKLAAAALLLAAGPASPLFAEEENGAEAETSETAVVEESSDDEGDGSETGDLMPDEEESSNGTKKSSSLLDRLTKNADAEDDENDDASDSADADSDSDADSANVVLFDIDGAVDEKGARGGFGAGQNASLRKLLLDLRDHCEDDDVDAIVLRINDFSASGSALQELCEALIKAREKKSVHAFVTGGSKGEMILASACDSVTIPPSHTAWLNGVAVDAMFFERLLGKLGIEMQVLQIGKYKSAMEAFSRQSFSEPARESYQALIDTMFEEMVEELAEGRGFSTWQAERILSSPPMEAEESLKADLVDRVLDEPEFYEWLRDEELGGREITWDTHEEEEDKPFEGDNPFQIWARLMGGSEDKKVKENSIAIVYLTGGIVDGPIDEAAYEDDFISAYPIVDLLEEVREEENVVAVVLRVDSGGGSAYASDRIWSAVERLKAEKPVVASMGNVAASGGYYVSMGADYIFANPMTITGSIGVIGGKPNMSALYDNIGLDVDTVERGRAMRLFDVSKPWNREEAEFMEKFMLSTYHDFIAKAAQGRGMEVEDIHEVGQGRVWSGRDALEIGLIDELGGLLASVDKAKELAGLETDERYPLEIYPRELTFAEVLERAFGGLNSGGANAPAWRGSFAEKVSAAFGPLVREVLPAEALNQAGLIYYLLKKDGVALTAPAVITVR